MRTHQRWSAEVRTMVVLALAVVGPAAGALAQPLPTEERKYPNPPEAIPAALANQAPNAMTPERLLQLRKAIQEDFRRVNRRGAAIQAPAPVEAPGVPATEVGVGAPALEVTQFFKFDAPSYRLMTHPNEAEPSVAATKDGQVVLLTANSFAAISKDAGQDWQFINPDSYFPQPPHKRFFCDQVVLHDPGHDLLIWYMQHHYYDDPGDVTKSGNLVRLAVAKKDDLLKDGQLTRGWRYYDFTPQDIGPQDQDSAKRWNAVELDFPDLALSDKFAYLTLNVYDQAHADRWGAVTLRLSLEELAGYKPLTYRVFSTVTDQGGVQCLRGTRGAKDTMYLGTNTATRQNNSFRIYSWPEASTNLTSKDVGISQWPGGSASAPGPDSRNWLGRVDGRLTAAWQDPAGRIGFAWGAPASPPNFPYPHIRAVVFQANTQAKLAEPILWSTSVAYTYPAIAASPNGQLGVSFAYGGGQSYPSYAVGTLEPGQQPGDKWSWHILSVAPGSIGPVQDGWGDYQWVCHDPGNPGHFLAAGFTCEPTSTGQTENRAAVWFTRFRKISAPAGPASAAPQALSDEQGKEAATRGEVHDLRRLISDLQLQVRKLTGELEEIKRRHR